MSKTFLLWEDIFTKKNFDLKKDLHFITADEIKAITNHEPRLMAKMDSSADLPEIFKRNGYFLLPIKNGEYAIVRGDGFHQLEKRGVNSNFISRIKFNLSTAARGLSEMQYLDYSFNSGALEKILGISPLYLSIRGREYSKKFKFTVNRSELYVSSVQIEVDSGFEGEDSIIIMEAKVKTPDDFIVRQLYYPYKHFQIVAPSKEIIPVFFTYEPSTKLYNYWVYEFTDPDNYNSIKLKETISLTINTAKEIELTDIKPKGIVDYKKLIPQANDLNKVVELVFKVSEGIDEYKNIAKYFGFDQRQSSYYREAAEALGLIASEKGVYKLTEIGTRLVALPVDNRNIFIVELLCDFNLIKSGLDIIKNNNKLTLSDIENLIRKESDIGGTTIPRRASSLAAWFKWISEATGSFVFDKDNKYFHVVK